MDPGIELFLVVAVLIGVTGVEWLLTPAPTSGQPVSRGRLSEAAQAEPVAGPRREESAMPTDEKYCRLCDQPALLEQRAPEKLMTVRGCACGTFEIGERLWDFGIKDLTPEDRQLLSERVRRVYDAGGAVRVVSREGHLTVDQAPTPTRRSAA
jgi:hypothetical protein